MSYGLVDVQKNLRDSATDSIRKAADRKHARDEAEKNRKMAERKGRAQAVGMGAGMGAAAGPAGALAGGAIGYLTYELF